MWIQTPRKVQLCKMRKVQIKKRLSDNGDEFRGELSETPDQGCNTKSTEESAESAVGGTVDIPH